MVNKLERIYPLILSIVALILYLYVGCHYLLIEKTIELVSDNLISIASTLLGFLLTILTIIESLQTRSIKIIRQAGGYPSLISYLHLSIISSFLSIPIVLIAKVYFSENIKNECVYSIMLFTECYLLLTSFRFIILFIKIIKT